MPLKRREFLKGLPVLLLSGGILTGCGKERKRGVEFQCMEAVYYDEKVLEKFCDTVVPGSSSDPDGIVGAVDTCALNLMFDESLMFKKVAPIIAFMIDEKAKVLYGKGFVHLNLDERTEVVKVLQSEFPLINLVMKFVKSAFYAGGYSSEGWKWMGYPGPNRGYFNDPQFSFWGPVCKEKTKDGNMP